MEPDKGAIDSPDNGIGFPDKFYRDHLPDCLPNGFIFNVIVIGKSLEDAKFDQISLSQTIGTQ
jgi:hypothetical protein